LSDQESIRRLRKALQEGDLTLFLGAGVSVGSGLPNWQQLVLAMYFDALEEAEPRGLRPFPNYLFAIAEWVLERRREPLEITARKIQRLYPPEKFLDRLQQTLYAGFRVDPNDRFIQEPPREPLLAQNQTLAAVIRLCRSGVRSVVSYNYDNLLEYGLGDGRAEPVWNIREQIPSGRLPVYHVHGYVPMRGTGSKPKEIVFTEEQYHSAAETAYSWSNLVQIQAMASSVGLMIGLSMTDPNMRRLLDAVRKIPVRLPHFALLQEPALSNPSDEDVTSIDGNAAKYYQRFTDSGIKTGASRFEKIRDLIRESEFWDRSHQTSLLRDLGVEPIWYQDHREIPNVIGRITAPARKR
jgi:hypothetical protein